MRHFELIVQIYQGKKYPYVIPEIVDKIIENKDILEIDLKSIFFTNKVYWTILSELMGKIKKDILEINVKLGSLQNKRNIWSHIK